MSENSNQTPTSRYLAQEASLISSVLCDGLTALRRSGAHDVGGFYSALFGLSIGIERMLKVIVILDHMEKNQGDPPDSKILRGLGHDLRSLFAKVQAIADNRGIDHPELSTYDDVTQDTIALLNDFALRTRYYNLNELGSESSGSDPIGEWSDILDRVIEQDIAAHVRKRIEAEIAQFAEFTEDIIFVSSSDLKGNSLGAKDSFYLPRMHELGVRYIILRILTLLSPTRDLIEQLCLKVNYGSGDPQMTVPFMEEFFRWLWADRAHVLRKKRWP